MVTRINGEDRRKPSVIEAKPLRRDAELNMARIVSAAQNVFAHFGYGASMEQIAAQAEVGIGTLYRRFPNKSDLFDAIIAEAIDQALRIVYEVTTEAPAQDAVFEFVRRFVANPTCWRAITSPRPWGGSEPNAALARLLPEMGGILSKSRDAGAIRPDIAVSDLVIALMSGRVVADLCDHEVPGASRRYLDLVLDGFRAGNQPSAHHPMTASELDQIFRFHTPAKSAERGSI
jgi:AcrR family transcriptional regulator